MAAVTICSDFGAQKNRLTLFPLFPHLFPMKWWDQMPLSSFSECWALSQLFHSPLSLSSRGFLVPLQFLPYANKGLSSQGYGFSSGHVWMWELDCEESWVPKNWCFWTVVLEKTLESPMDCKEIQPVHSEGDQPWDFFGRNDAKAETPVLWPPHAQSWLIGKDSDAGRDWEQEKKGTTKDEMAGWHHQLSGHRFGWTPGVGDGQGSLVCCGSWSHRESDTTKRLNWTEVKYRRIFFGQK